MSIPSPGPLLDAGEFGAWLAGMRSVLRDDLETTLACGECTACCTSGYFVTLRPSDREARARIPTGDLVPGPAGRALLGYDERGHCRMLRDGRCTIYAHRPTTCRSYDCRVYAAAGIGPGRGRPAIAARVRRWAFTYGSDEARRAHDAVRRAARFLRDDATSFAPGSAPSRPAEVAVAALRVYEAFVDVEVPEDRNGKAQLARRVAALLHEPGADAGAAACSDAARGAHGAIGAPASRGTS